MDALLSRKFCRHEKMDDRIVAFGTKVPGVPAVLTTTYQLNFVAEGGRSAKVTFAPKR